MSDVVNKFLEFIVRWLIVIGKMIVGKAFTVFLLVTVQLGFILLINIDSTSRAQGTTSLLMVAGQVVTITENPIQQTSCIKSANKWEHTGMYSPATKSGLAFVRKPSLQMKIYSA